MLSSGLGMNDIAITHSRTVLSGTTPCIARSFINVTDAGLPRNGNASSMCFLKEGGYFQVVMYCYHVSQELVQDKLALTIVRVIQVLSEFIEFQWNSFFAFLQLELENW